jgi:hypothetical protein
LCASAWIASLERRSLIRFAEFGLDASGSGTAQQLRQRDGSVRGDRHCHRQSHMASLTKL